MFGDILENLKPDEIRIVPALPTIKSRFSDHIMLSDAAPSNQAILDATKRFYARDQKMVDTTARNTKSVSDNHKDFVAQLNSKNWQNKTLTEDEKKLTSEGIFGNDGKKGSFDDSLNSVKASSLWRSFAVGVSAEVVILAGGFGGLGCAWDIDKREGPKGYGYATYEVGLKFAADENVQACIFNRPPSNLNTDIYGLTVSVYAGGGYTFVVFWTGPDPFEDEALLGYSLAVGLGAGGGASVFGGYIWNFG